MIGMLPSRAEPAAGDSECIHLSFSGAHACDSTGVSLVDSFDVLCDYNEHLTDNCFQMHKVTAATLSALYVH
jgi:hypothetical protein